MRINVFIEICIHCYCENMCSTNIAFHREKWYENMLCPSSLRQKTSISEEPAKPHGPAKFVPLLGWYGFGQCVLRLLFSSSDFDMAYHWTLHLGDTQAILTIFSPHWRWQHHSTLWTLSSAQNSRLIAGACIPTLAVLESICLVS